MLPELGQAVAAIRNKPEESRSIRCKEGRRAKPGGTRRDREPAEEDQIPKEAQERRRQGGSIAAHGDQAAHETSVPTGGQDEDPSLCSGLYACKAGGVEEEDVLPNTWTGLRFRHIPL